MKILGSLLTVSLLTLTACEDEKRRRCAEGTTKTDGVCVPDIAGCEAGTTLVDGVCVTTEEACAEGSIWQNGACVPDLFCGEGTRAEAGSCVPDVLLPPEVEESPEPNGEVGFPVPSDDEQTTLGGVIDLGVDTSGDGWVEPDWDVFTFNAQRGTYLRITATSDGAARPAFRVRSRETRPDGRPLYERYGQNPEGVTCARELYLPRTGEYLVEVSEHGHVSHALYGEPALPVGGDDFTYHVTVQNLGRPNALELTPMPKVYEGDLGDGRLHFFEIPAGDERLVTLRSAGKPLYNAWNDVVSSLMVFVGERELLWDLTAEDTNRAIDRLINANADQRYLVVQDFWAILGPLSDFRLDADEMVATDCDEVDCGSASLPERTEHVLRWDLVAGDFFVSSVYIGEGEVAIWVTFLDETFTPTGEDQIAYGGYNAVGQHYAEQDGTVYAWIREYAHNAVPEYRVEAAVHATPALEANRTASNLPVFEMPPFTLFNAGVAHYAGEANQVVFFSSLATNGAGWVAPNEFVFTADMENIGPSIDTNGWNFPESFLTPPFVYLREPGHLLYLVNDPNGDIAANTYDIRVGTETPRDLGPLTQETPIIANTQGLGGGLTFFTYGGEANQWAEITVTPTSTSDLEPEVWVLNFGYPLFDWVYYVWQGDADAKTLGLIRTVSADAPRESVTFTYVSPYDGPSVLLVMNKTGGAGFLDTFNIELAVPPAPDNDTCGGGNPIQLTGGAATINGQLKGASNTLDAVECIEVGLAGPNLFYELVLNAGDELSFSLDAEWPAALYLLSDCDGTCVAMDVADSPRVIEYTVPPGAGATYRIGIDTTGYGKSLVEQGGDFTLDVLVNQ